MKKLYWFFGLLVFVFTTGVQAKDNLQVSDAWLPQAPPVAKVMAGYMKVNNPTKQDITIQSVSSPAFNSIEMHETVTENGVAKMIRQESLKVAAGKNKIFQRGGLHLMMFKPKRPLKLDEAVTINLKTNVGMISIKAKVKQAQLEDHSHHHHHH